MLAKLLVECTRVTFDFDVACAASHFHFSFFLLCTLVYLYMATCTTCPFNFLQFVVPIHSLFQLYIQSFLSRTCICNCHEHGSTRNKGALQIYKRASLWTWPSTTAVYTVAQFVVREFTVAKGCYNICFLHHLLAFHYSPRQNSPPLCSKEQREKNPRFPIHVF